MAQQHIPGYAPYDGTPGFSYLTCSCKALKLLGNEEQLAQTWDMHLAAVEKEQHASRLSAFTECHALVSKTARITAIDVHLERNPVQIANLTGKERMVFNLGIAALAIGALTSDVLKTSLAETLKESRASVYRAVKEMPGLLTRNAEARVRCQLTISRLREAIAILAPQLAECGQNFTFELPPEWTAALEQDHTVA